MMKHGIADYGFLSHSRQKKALGLPTAHCLLPFLLLLSLLSPCLAADKAIGIAEAVRSLPDSMQTPNRYALVIGVGQYEDKRIPQLPACVNDARRIYELLVDPTVGLFEPERVVQLADEMVSRARVVQALDQLSRRVDKDDLVVVFFSGHGAVDERGRSYWVMHDSNLDSMRATALSEVEISELLGEIKTTRLVMLIDTCYSASTAELGRSKSLPPLSRLYPQFEGQGRVAITASRGDQLSVVIKDDNHPGYGHSAFTWHVIEALEGRADTDYDGVVTVDELWGHVKDRTATTARREGGNQQPQLKGQIGSRFMLTIDSERFLAKTVEVQEALKILKQLFLENELDAVHYNEAEFLLQRSEDRLDDQQRRRREVYLDLCSQRLAPSYLQSALDAIETPEQREARLKREAAERAERQKRERIRSLWATARAHDNPTDGQRALTALEELLYLDPQHAQALALQLKIQGYYGPVPGRVTTNSIDMNLVWIPAGDFKMGSPTSERHRNNEDEGPQHQVTIDQGFWLGQYEVTQAQYRAVMGSNPSRFKGDTLPVERVSWDEAVAFCRQLSRKEGKTYRLPTEAEWEYACRAGSDTAFAFGKNIKAELANFDASSLSNAPDARRKKTLAVGSFSPNDFGLYDMHGNVWEWCQDWYDKDYYARNYKPGIKGPQSGKYRVKRGGSYSSFPWDCRSAARNSIKPNYSNYDLGFRVVLEDAED